MQLVNNYQYLDETTIKRINRKIEYDTDFDEERFNAWLEIVGVKEKRNPSAYVISCFDKEYEKGTFKIKQVEYIPNTQVFINAMRERGICVMANEAMYVDVLFRYLMSERNVDEATCVRLNHQILDYMKQGQSFDDYKKIIQKANTLKPYKVDWNYIEKQTIEEVIKWDNILKESEVNIDD